MRVCDVELNILLHRMDVMDFEALYRMEQASRCVCDNCRITNDHANMLMQQRCLEECGPRTVVVLGEHFMVGYDED